MQNNIFQVTLRGLSYELPQGEKLFQNISISLQQKRYGLVGANGVGKSTLARILAGEILGFQGGIERTQDVLYFAQQVELPLITVAEYLADIWEIPSDYASLILSLIGDIPVEKELSVLSGGELMRVRLAKALQRPHGLLILDEPTNNLDQSSRKRLYAFVEEYQGALLVISHDRVLLQKMDMILELSSKGLSVYGGNYEFYENERDRERQRELDKLDELRRLKKKAEKEQVEKVMSQEKRMREGRKLGLSGSLPRILVGGRKRQAQVTMGRTQVLAEQLKDKAALDFESHWQSLKKEIPFGMELLESSIPERKLVLEVSDFNLKYAGQESFLWEENLNLIMKGPKRWAFSGDNGSGKTSLLKSLLQTHTSLTEPNGFAKVSDMPWAYLDQKYEVLNPEKTVLENIEEKARSTRTELRNLLAHFQFTADKVHRKARDLSGGEKLKASLAKILLADPAPQLLILDEPTNNLDLQSLEVLESALRQFEGALLVVSHDEVFLENIGIEQVIAF